MGGGGSSIISRGTVRCVVGRACGCAHTRLAALGTAGTKTDGGLWLCFLWGVLWLPLSSSAEDRLHRSSKRLSLRRWASTAPPTCEDAALGVAGGFAAAAAARLRVPGMGTRGVSFVRVIEAHVLLGSVDHIFCFALVGGWCVAPLMSTMTIHGYPAKDRWCDYPYCVDQRAFPITLWMEKQIGPWGAASLFTDRHRRWTPDCMKMLNLLLVCGARTAIGFDHFPPVTSKHRTGALDWFNSGRWGYQPHLGECHQLTSGTIEHPQHPSAPPDSASQRCAPR